VTVYVDPLFPTEPRPRWPFDQACHMTADTVGELHSFADRLKLKREWFQPVSLPHYDLTPGKRRAAVMLGAVELDLHQAAAHIKRLRQSLGKPEGT
jgi:hypothetical protein